MIGTSHLFPNGITAGLILALFLGVAALILHPYSLQQILTIDIQDTIFDSTLFAFLAVFVLTLFASLSGRILALLGLWLADRRGRDLVYQQFNSTLPEDIRSRLDGIISDTAWACITEHSHLKRFFLLIYDHLAALNFDIYSTTCRDYVVPTELLRNVSSVLLVGGLILTTAWCISAAASDTWALTATKLILGIVFTLATAEFTMRLCLASLRREMRRFLRMYLVVQNVKNSEDSPSTE